MCLQSVCLVDFVHGLVAAAVLRQRVRTLRVLNSVAARGHLGAMLMQSCTALHLSDILVRVKNMRV